jgi:hypothetical protein
MRFSRRRAAWSLVAPAAVVSLTACGGGAILAGDVTVLISERTEAGMDALGGGRIEVAEITDVVVGWPAPATRPWSLVAAARPATPPHQCRTDVRCGLGL